ncbi:zinc finger C-x8-C-x5-C-x3-H type family protein [Actinidia rufa]|uniref:Zinc finger C-x8-C-x5-C-x3-H type family protein n=1 Tax=Actinidia rufa TaxID=165716 RepID=A0A7J0EMV2_9ERIC|nr:zinc finger C-x8-C-x5-C-x3-H type family protein [Actinidia rufa]
MHHITNSLNHHETSATRGGEATIGEPSSGGGGGGETILVSTSLALLAIGGSGDSGTAAAGGGSSIIHPDRGWRGIHPRPVFSRNEFGDILGQAEEEMAAAMVVNEAETGGDKEEEEVVVAAVAEGREEVAAEKGWDGVDLKEEPPRKLLDLNRPPSPDE